MNSSSTRIVIVSDTHLAERAAEYRNNWDIIKRWIGREAPDLVVHLGDISANGILYRDDLEVAANILNGGGAPLRLIPGNHDVGDNPTSGAGQHAVSEADIEVYRRLFGDDYWSLDLPDWQIVALNAQLLGSGLPAEATQRAWLQETLARGRGRVGLMLHKPLFRNIPEESDIHPRYIPLAARRRLLDDLRKRDLAFVASGHTHQTRRHVAGGVLHVWAPSTAFVLPDRMQEPIGDKIVGAMILDLAPGRFSFRLVVPDGLRQYNVIDYPHVYPEVIDIGE